MTAQTIRDERLGVAFSIDERFADVGFARDEELPTAHFIASAPADGWIAALAIVTVRAEPLPADEWLAGQLGRARASFAAWSPEAHEMLVAPEASALAGRLAIHVRYRLFGSDPEDGATSADAGPVPSSLVEHWTVLVEERRWLLAMELMVQPPSWWDEEREAFELPLRTLELIGAPRCHRSRPAADGAPTPCAVDDRNSHLEGSLTVESPADHQMSAHPRIGSTP